MANMWVEFVKKWVYDYNRKINDDDEPMTYMCALSKPQLKIDYQNYKKNGNKKSDNKKNDNKKSNKKSDNKKNDNKKNDNKKSDNKSEDIKIPLIIKRLLALQNINNIPEDFGISKNQYIGIINKLINLYYQTLNKDKIYNQKKYDKLSDDLQKIDEIKKNIINEYDLVKLQIGKIIRYIKEQALEEDE